VKVTAIETIRVGEFPNLLWVQVLTDEGVTGLGETFYGPAAAEGHIHGIIAPYLIGKDPRNIEAHQAHLTGYIGFTGASAEMRGRSAIDIALWDILGQSVALPLCDLLGGRVREEIKVYNTCAGYSYVRTRPTQGTDNFGLDAAKGQYEDLDAFLNRADELAVSLLEQGITAMKIWLFDYAAERTSGHWIDADELRPSLVPFEKVRRAVGDRMDIAAELHSLWSRPQAIKIAQALEPLQPMWVEDPVFMDHLHSIGEVARATRVPIAVGETRGGRADFRVLLEPRGAVNADHGPDVGWRRERGAQGGGDGGGLARACGVPRLHGAGGAGGVDASCAARTQLLGAGDGARLLLRLVPSLRYRAAAGDEGPDHRVGRTGTRARPATRDRATPGRRGEAHDAQRSLRHPPPVPANGERIRSAPQMASVSRTCTALSRLTCRGCWLGRRTIAISQHG
jgi:L-alanine-DL-glutamate epimerase-like enolase superfamily enzyme